jgi:hypothetical protein
MECKIVENRRSGESGGIGVCKQVPIPHVLRDQMDRRSQHSSNVLGPVVGVGRKERGLVVLQDRRHLPEELKQRSFVH